MSKRYTKHYNHIIKGQNNGSHYYLEIGDMMVLGDEWYDEIKNKWIAISPTDDVGRVYSEPTIYVRRPAIEGKTYYLLKYDEIMCEGDEVYDSIGEKWVKLDGIIGLAYKNTTVSVRRPSVSAAANKEELEYLIKVLEL